MVRHGRSTPESCHLTPQGERERWAMDGARGAREKNLTFCEAFGCSHVFGLFSLGGLPPAMRPLWPLALM
jgi:hypothetical protein